MSGQRRKWAFLALAAVALVTLACQQTRVVLEVSNRSEGTIDFVYAEDFIDLREFGRDYNVLSVGDTDTYQGCTECEMRPGGVFMLETPLSSGQSVVIAARVADSERLIFIQRYTFEELRELEWMVSLVEMGGR